MKKILSLFMMLLCATAMSAQSAVEDTPVMSDGGKLPTENIVGKWTLADDSDPETQIIATYAFNADGTCAFRVDMYGSIEEAVELNGFAVNIGKYSLNGNHIMIRYDESRYYAEKVKYTVKPEADALFTDADRTKLDNILKPAMKKFDSEIAKIMKKNCKGLQSDEIYKKSDQLVIGKMTLTNENTKDNQVQVIYPNR